MKFGFRTPSLKKRLAARTSFKRVIRHSVGLKAPSGMGILTNPRKAVYNKVYNQTTSDLFQSKSYKKSNSTKNSLAAFYIFIVLLAVILLFVVPPVGIGIIAILVFFYLRKIFKKNVMPVAGQDLTSKPLETN